MLTTGLDLESAFSAVGACLNNLGPGLGSVSENYANINSASKGILAFAMLLGRLEIFTLLVIITPGITFIEMSEKLDSGNIISTAYFLFLRILQNLDELFS